MLKHEIVDILAAAHKDRVTPGAVVGWISNSTQHIIASGKLTYDLQSPSVTEDTLYDVASVTKSIPLASLAHIALQEGKLSLYDTVVNILPALSGKHHQLIQIKHLLTYTAIWDLPKGLSQYAQDGAKAVIEAIQRLPLQAKPGQAYLYTNAPAVVLGMVLEQVYSQPLSELAQSKLFDPLAMRHTTFDPSEVEDTLVAPSEVDHRGEVHKVVHDETAYVLHTQLSRASGNAGMFSTAGDLLKFCAMVLDGGVTPDGQRIFSQQTIAAFQQNYLSDIGACAALGWELYQPRFMGHYSHPKLFGKTGFTGCLVLIDVPNQKAMVQLSNAMYPKRHTSRTTINKFRTALADVIFSEK